MPIVCLGCAPRDNLLNRNALTQSETSCGERVWITFTDGAHDLMPRRDSCSNKANVLATYVEMRVPICLPPRD